MRALTLKKRVQVSYRIRFEGGPEERSQFPRGTTILMCAQGNPKRSASIYALFPLTCPGMLEPDDPPF